MAKVLRGGKWGTVPRGIASCSQTPTQTEEDQSHAPIEADQLEQGACPAWPLDLGPSADSGTITAFVEEKNHLGVACYDLASSEIYISKVSCETDYSNATRVVNQLDAITVVLPNSYKSKDDLLDSIRGSHHEYSANPPPSSVAESNIRETNTNVERTEDDTEHDGDTDRMVSYVANGEFGIAKSKELCGFIKVRGSPEHMTATARYDYLCHLVGEEECVLRAIGGLLAFVVQNGVLAAVATDDESIEINAIRHRNFCDVMDISPTTLRALHVFSQDTHPIGRGGLTPKEGLSLYGILKSHVKTGAARKLLRLWLLYPSTNIQTVTERQFVVDFLRRSSNAAILQALNDALRGVKNAPGVLCRLRKICGGINDWKALYSSLKSFIIVLDTMKVAMQQNEDVKSSPLFAHATSVSETHLRQCVDWIDAVVDFEESTASGKLVVAQGFSEEIDEMKRCHSGLDDFLTSVAVQEHENFLEMDNPPSLSSLCFTYQPQIGYLVMLSKADVDRVGFENLKQCGMSFIFSSPEQGYHFKNDRCTQLDDELGDIYGAIMDLESKAYRYLETKVFEASASILEVAALVRELDCLQAFACAANEFSWTKPNFLEDEDRLVVEDGRHPLLELVVPSYVPNSTNLRGGDIQIVTGPNYSGKSVYLTQVALIVIMAQIGSFVPAKRTVMVLVECIRSRISSFESISHGHSSFFIDASQVAQMLAPKKSGRGLYLLDEFGKGTLEADGMALLVAALRELLARPVADAPLCLCTTHFVEILKDPCLPVSDPRLSMFSMEVMTKPNTNLARRSKRPKLLSARDSVSVGTRLSRLVSRVPSEAADQGESDEREQVHSVVRTYRLLPGSVCQESRALQCALEAGVPRFILQRAAHVHSAISGNSVIAHAVATSENNPRIRNCADAVRKLMSIDPSDSLK